MYQEVRFNRRTEAGGGGGGINVGHSLGSPCHFMLATRLYVDIPCLFLFNLSIFSYQQAIKEHGYSFYEKPLYAFNCFVKSFSFMGINEGYLLIPVPLSPLSRFVPFIFCQPPLPLPRGSGRVFQISLLFVCLIWMKNCQK